MNTTELKGNWNEQKGKLKQKFAPFSAKFGDSITVFIINANLLLALPDSL